MVLILNDVSGSEILLILIFVLIFFGAKSIPGLARTLGRAMRQIKDASADIQNEIRKSGADMKKDLNLKGIIEETAEDIRRPLDQHARDIENAVKFEPPRTHSHLHQTAQAKPEEEVTGETEEEPKEPSGPKKEEAEDKA